LKQVLHKISAIALAFIVLFSSLSFSVYEHICGGEIAEVSYFSEVDSCDMVMSLCEAIDTSQQSIHKKPCCNDHAEIFQGNDINQQAQSSLEISQMQFLAVFVTSYISLFKEANIAPLYNNYSPPLVVKNIHKLDETYLI